MWHDLVVECDVDDLELHRVVALRRDEHDRSCIIADRRLVAALGDPRHGGADAVGRGSREREPLHHVDDREVTVVVVTERPGPCGLARSPLGDHDLVVAEHVEGKRECARKHGDRVVSARRECREGDVRRPDPAITFVVHGCSRSIAGQAR